MISETKARTIAEAIVYRASLPLDRPYPVAFGIIEALDSLIVELRDPDGKSGWGEVTIITGYTHETVESAWNYGLTRAEALLGADTRYARRQIVSDLKTQAHAASPFLMAIEMLEDHRGLATSESCRIPLIAPVRAMGAGEIREEVASLLDAGHTVLKVKVGFDVANDIDRLAVVADMVGERARLRVDANQGYGVVDALQFAASLDVAVVEWFEQPCDRQDWEANAAVALAAPVPVMLDESVYGFDDIQRCAGLDGIDYVKIEMEKFGGLELTRAGLEYIRHCGLTPVCGNGAASDITSWFEARAGQLAGLQMAGEMHGFRKLRTPLFAEPLGFEDGALVIEAGYWPCVDRETLESVTQRRYVARKSEAAGTY